MGKVDISIGIKSIDGALQKLNKYKNRISENLKAIQSVVAKELRDEIYAGYNGANYNYILYEGYQVPNVGVYIKNDGEATIVYTDASMAAWVIEFGAGVYYNPSGISYPDEMRPNNLMKIGTYGKGYGSRPVWGYYETPGDKSTLKLTHGTPSSMPIYHAIQEISPKVIRIVKETFGGG